MLNFSFALNWFSLTIYNDCHCKFSLMLTFFIPIFFLNTVKFKGFVVESGELKYTFILFIMFVNVLLYNPKSEKVGTVWKTQIKKRK